MQLRKSSPGSDNVGLIHQVLSIAWINLYDDDDGDDDDKNYDEDDEDKP